jgi:hypothetical protein
MNPIYNVCEREVMARQLDVPDFDKTRAHPPTGQYLAEKDADHLILPPGSYLVIIRPEYVRVGRGIYRWAQAVVCTTTKQKYLKHHAK